MVSIHLSGFNVSAYDLHTFTPNELEIVFAAFKESFDTPVGGYRNPYDCFTYFYNKPFSVLLSDDAGTQLYGMTALTYSTEHDTYLTTTILFKDWRGSGLNMELKRVAATAANTLGVNVGCVIRHWNERSMKACTKAFPNSEPKIVRLPISPRNRRTQKAHYYCYNENSFPKPTITINNYQKIWENWLNQHNTKIRPRTLQLH